MAVPLISTIIPSYNYGRFLPKAIESVLDQTYPAVELIIVDDGSSDGSQEILDRYGDRLRWVQQCRKGVSAARNRGIDLANGSYVAFLDADDWWHPTKLSRQAAEFSHPLVGMVYCGLQYIDEMGELTNVQNDGCSGWVLRDLALLRPPGVPASGSSALISRQCLDRVGLFNESLSTSADWDMWRRIACHFRIERVPAPLVYYRQHGSAMHLNLAAFEADMLRAFGSMFEDTAAPDLLPLRHGAYANLFYTLSASFARSGQFGPASRYALKYLVARGAHACAKLSHVRNSCGGLSRQYRR